MALDPGRGDYVASLSFQTRMKGHPLSETQSEWSAKDPQLYQKSGKIYPSDCPKTQQVRLSEEKR